jgi:hypothetical protein
MRQPGHRTVSGAPAVGASLVVSAELLLLLFLLYSTEFLELRQACLVHKTNVRAPRGG